MTIRKAETGDVQAIFAFCDLLIKTNARMSFEDARSVRIVKDWLNDPSMHLYLAVEDEKVVGMFRGKRGQGKKYHAAYVACAVHPDYRKRNIAHDLTLFGLSDLKNQGVLVARTYIYSWNTASIKTIEKCGFKNAGRVYMHEYDKESGQFIDDLIYHKVLRSSYESKDNA